MSKDPAVLIYIDKWVASTNDLKASFRAWYLDLLLYQYDNGSVPDDEDTIYGICRVRPSEYNEFNQMLNQVLKRKFKQTEKGWINEVMNNVLQSRNNFKEKRTISANIGVVVKMAKSFDFVNDSIIEKLKNHLFNLPSEEVEKLKNKQVLKQMLKLYIDVNVDVDINEIGFEKEGSGEKTLINNSTFSTEAKKENTQWSEAIRMQHKISHDFLLEKLNEFDLHLINTQEQKKSFKDYVTHFSYWLNTSKGNNKSDNSKFKKEDEQKLGRMTITEAKKNFTNFANVTIPGQNE